MAISEGVGELGFGRVEEVDGSEDRNYASPALLEELGPSVLRAQKCGPYASASRHLLAYL